MTDHITIGDISPWVQYVGDGEQTQFVYPFPIFAVADIAVYLDDTLQADGFTVSGVGVSSGGSVTFDTAPAASVRVTLRRDMTIQRTTDFQEGGAFRASVVNDELDRQTAAAQQIETGLGRAMRLAVTDVDADLTLPSKVARANNLLGFDAEGRPTAASATVDAAMVTPFAETVLDDADGPTMRTTLGIPNHDKVAVDNLGNLALEVDAPILDLIDTGGGTNEKRFYFHVNNGQFQLRSENDAQNQAYFAFVAAKNSGANTIAHTSLYAGAGTEIVRAEGQGLLLPGQPMFIAKPSSDQNDYLGDNSTYDFPANTELLDRGGNYNNSTYTFTAPLTGVYRTWANVTFSSLTSSHSSSHIYFVTSNGNLLAYHGNLGGNRDAVNLNGMHASQDILFDAGDTCKCVIGINNGSKVVDIKEANSHWGMCLVG